MSSFKFKPYQPDGQEKSFACEECATKCANERSLKRHIQKHHAEPKDTDRNQCCLLCDMTFSRVATLVQHYDHVHHQTIETEDLTFATEQEFKVWKDSEEVATGTHFIAPRGTYVSGTRTYVCNRSGASRAHQPPDQVKGSRKLGVTCISRLIVRLGKDGGLAVHYVSTHCGHNVGEDQLRYLPIPASTRSEIVRKLAMGVQIERILKDIRQEYAGEAEAALTRRILLSRKEIRNIARGSELLGSMRHANDQTAVRLLIEEWSQGTGQSPCLGIKYQDLLSEAWPYLRKDTFVLVLQTAHQQELYKAHASKIICCDATHGTNMYQFKLITLMVVDNYGYGRTVAWCISDREDEATLTAFLGAVKEHNPEVPITTLMTDGDLAGAAAARKVFGADIRHLLCTWHILRSVLRQIQHKFRQQKETAQAVYSSFFVLLLEKDKDKFDMECKGFLQYLEETSEDFLKYFTDHLLPKKESWAYCHRQFDHCNVNTNNIVEGFHSKLKHHPQFLSGLQNRRIESLITKLMELEMDEFIDGQRLKHGIKIGRYQRKMAARHENGSKIVNSHIEETDVQGKYQVASQSEPGWQHTVVVQSVPHENCTTTCSLCGGCRHSVTCTCADYLSGSLCKHAHRVFSIAFPNERCDVEPNTMDDIGNPPEPSIEVLQQPVRHEARSAPAKDMEIRELATAISETPAFSPFIIDNVLGLLRQANSIISAGPAAEAGDSEGFPVGQAIPSRKMPERQSRGLFHATTRKSGMKRKASPLRAPTEKEKQHLTETVLMGMGPEAEVLLSPTSVLPSVSDLSPMPTSHVHSVTHVTESIQERSEQMPATPTAINFRAVDCSWSSMTLSGDTHVQVEKALSMPSNAAVCRLKRGAVTGQAMATLKSGVWLDDEIINAFVECLMNSANDLMGPRTVLAMPTFAFTDDGKATRIIDEWRIFQDRAEFNVIIMPLHFTAHWALMVMDTKARVIYHYDSAKISNPAIHAATAIEHIGPPGQVWEQVKVDNLPQQINAFDCGAFVCLSAACHIFGTQLVDVDIRRDSAAMRHWICAHVLQQHMQEHAPSSAKKACTSLPPPPSS
ncbi:uncharacterized protein LOC135829695 isoform X2 [Sycon ciliatum]|uniref:uncharacterized protein LOC135829695 isoform X2 n=1 Tax=Sycon ciliatum TaxID=27933 RepID=UPI0031F67622